MSTGLFSPPLLDSFVKTVTLNLLTALLSLALDCLAFMFRFILSSKVI